MYYNWLLDINGFDYSKFNANWLSVFFSENYNKHFRESKVLKVEIEKIMKSEKARDYKGLARWRGEVQRRKNRGY